MASAPFSIFKRNSKDRTTGKAVLRYVARFFDEDGNVVKTKTLEATSPTKAALEAKTLLDKGEGTVNADPFVMDFLDAFWKVDSDYARMKVLRGRPLSLKYVEGNAYLINRHLREPLSGIRLRSLNVPRIERIMLDLAAKGANPRTINTVLQALRVPVSDYARKHRICLT
jgi:hypothetical protein